MKRPISVLILEKSEVFSRYLTLLLRQMGLKSLSVREPEAAKSVLLRGFSDVLIIGDLKYPELPHVIVKDLANCIVDNSIPIIVVSNCADLDEKKACYDAGCHAYLTKPIQPKMLHDALYAGVKPLKERRKNLRSKVDLSAEITIQNQQSKTYDILNLSKGGCFISSSQIVPTGTKITLNVLIAEEQIYLSGTVLYNLTSDKGSGIEGFGVLFHHVKKIDADIIEQYLERVLNQENLLTEESK